MLTEATPVGGGSFFSVIIIPLLILIGFLCYLAIRFVKNHCASVRAGTTKKFNRLFIVLCMLGGLNIFLIIGFINDWEFYPSEILLYLVLLIIPGIITQCLYFIPYLIANKKGHSQENAIFILNLLAGWTIIAWIIALVWAFTEPKQIANTQQPLKSNADELLKYKELLDSGAISQEEFDAKKKQILDV